MTGQVRHGAVRILRIFLGAAIVALWLAVMPGLATAQQTARSDVRAYFFGNSLVHHVSASDETAVPHWLALLALADGREFAADGQFGFLRNFAADLPPLATWSFGKVRRAWRRGAQDFARVGFDSAIITPANFIQDVPSDTPYRDGSGDSPLGATLRIVDWLADQDPDIRIFIYGGWPEMASITRGFPPSADGIVAYHRAAQTSDAAWYEAYVTALRDARPGVDIRLIPVGRQLSRALSTPPFDTIPATDLYEDDAPHGTPSLYAMAAIVTYHALFGAAPPDSFDWPDTIHPVLRAGMPDLVALLTGDAAPAPLPPTAPGTAADAPAAPASTDAAAPMPEIRPAPITPALDLTGPPGTGLADPALAMGLNGVDDWTAQQPFLDLMKTARPWIGHSATQWGAFSFEDLQAEGAIGPEGWPTRIPDGADRLETFLLTDMAEGATALEGTYVLTHRGSGRLEVSGRVRRTFAEPGRVSFQYQPGEGLVSLTLYETDPADPIRDIVVVREDRLALHEAGALFNPDWLRLVSDLRSVRFMDWMRTNASPVAEWDDRARPGDATYSWRGVPLEVMLALANRIGADPWFTLPHLASDAYMAEFAMAVRDGLDPRLQAYVEYSNELWNFAFPQTQWAAAEAARRWGPGQPDDAWIQLAGARMAEMAEIWQAVYGEDFDARVKVVMAVHTGWQGLEEAQMQAPLWRADRPGRKPPAAYADAYAVTGYFGYEFGTDAFAPTLESWLDASEAAATAAGEAEGKSRVALREYVNARLYDQAIAPAATALRDGPLRALVTEIWPYHAEVAARAGLELVMYEGGSHVAALGGQTANDRLTGYLATLNYTPEMARLYDTLLAGWVDAGGTLFNAFVDVATPGRWGSWGALRHLSDDNPRWRSLMRYNQTARPGFAPRAAGTFLDGVTRIGTSGGDVLEGTVEEDVLIAGPGDDVLVSHGRGDMLHGGPGTDTARLPGTAAMYSFVTAPDGALIATGPHGPVRLVAVEALEFEGAPGLRLDTATLR